MGDHATDVSDARNEPGTTARFDVFLSHNHADADVVQRIAGELRDAGLQPWLDAWCVTGGREWQEELAEGINSAASCAVFVGPSDVRVWEREEFHVALDRAATDPTFRVFLVLLPGVPEPFDAGMLSPFLSARTWVDLRRGLAHPDTFRHLLHVVKGMPFGRPTPLAQDPDVCPYRGLAPFDEDDVDLFFGREAEVQRLVEKLKASTFLAIVGPSGSGKSSLVRAGLIPAVRRGALHGSEAWAVPVFRPGPHPLDNLARQLARAIPDIAARRVCDELGQDPRTLRLLLAGRDGDRRVMGVIDQFEEIFTLCTDEHERRMFVLNVLHASTADGPGTVVLTMRPDFYPRCAAYPELAQQLAAHQFLVGPLDDMRLRQVIEEPAHQVGLRFGPGLVETILDDVHEEVSALPLLQHALLELWKRRLGDTLTLAGYHESGGVTGALARRADDVWGNLNPTEQQTARRVMLRLTQPREGTQYTRRRAAETELVSGGDAPETVERVVQALVDGRLLTVDIDDSTGRRLLNLPHEALIRGWPQLRIWIDDDREGLREHRRLSHAAHEWRDLDRDPGNLYRGARLAAATEWAAGHEDQLDELEREFLTASTTAERQELEEHRKRAEQEARAARRLRLLVVGLVALLLATAGATWYVDVQRREAHAAARRNAAEALAGRGADLAGSQGRLGLLLALEAYEMDDTPVVRSGLLQTAIMTSRMEAVLHGHDGPVHTVAASAVAHAWVGDRLLPQSDGPVRLVASGGEDGAVRMWDTATHEAIGDPLVGHEGKVGTVAISPDGRLLASAGTDDRILVWDVATGQRFGAPLEGHTDDVLTVRFWPGDGGELASASADGTIRLWDVDRPSDPLVLQANGGDAAAGSGRDTGAHDVRDLALHPEGQMLATAGGDGTIELWGVDGTRLTDPTPAHDGEAVADLEFARGGTVLVSAGGDRRVRFWDVDAQGGLAQRAARDARSAPVSAVATSADGGLAATSGTDGRVIVWDVETATPLHDEPLRAHQRNVLSLAFNPDGGLLSSGVDGCIVRLDVAGSLPASLGRSLTGHRLEATTDSVVVAGASRRVVWRDRTSLREVDASPPFARPVTALAARSAQRDTTSESSAVVAAGSEDGTVRLWDQSRRPVAAPADLGAEVTSLAFSPIAPLLIAAESDEDNGAGHVVVYDLDRRQIIKRLPDLVKVRDVAVSPDGRLVAAAGGDPRVRLYDLRELRRHTVLPLTHTSWAVAVAFHPEGDMLATGSLDGTIAVWDVEAGRQVVRPLRGESAEVSAVAFSPGGGLLAAAATNGAVELWDLRDPHRPEWLGLVSAPHTTWTWGLSFTPDGRLITAADDRTAVVWTRLLTQDDIDDWRAHVCGIVASPLSSEEWRLHLGDEPFTPSCSVDGSRHRSRTGRRS